MYGQWNHRNGQTIVTRLAGLMLSGQILFGVGLTAMGPTGTGLKAFGAEEIEPAPPKGQHYVGKNTCAACHYSKYRIWRKDKHALGFEILPKKYRQEPKCLICHTTGYGDPTGYKGASTPQLAGTTCEACHGPGSEHAKLAQKLFLGAEAEVTLAAEQKIRDSIARFLEKQNMESMAAEEQARRTIYRVQPGNACIRCHITKAHQAHPDYDKP